MKNFRQPLEARETDMGIQILPRGVPGEPQCLWTAMLKELHLRVRVKK